MRYENKFQWMAQQRNHYKTNKSQSSGPKYMHAFAVVVICLPSISIICTRFMYGIAQCALCTVHQVLHTHTHTQPRKTEMHTFTLISLQRSIGVVSMTVFAGIGHSQRSAIMVSIPFISWPTKSYEMHYDPPPYQPLAIESIAASCVRLKSHPSYSLLLWYFIRWINSNLSHSFIPRAVYWTKQN